MALMDKTAFLEKMKRTDRYFAVKFDIEEMPEVDPVHAAGGCYCRECKHRGSMQDPSHGRTINYCHKWDNYTEKHAFCSYGHRKESADG